MLDLYEIYRPKEWRTNANVVGDLTPTFHYQDRVERRYPEPLEKALKRVANEIICGKVKRSKKEKSYYVIDKVGFTHIMVFDDGKLWLITVYAPDEEYRFYKKHLAKY